MTITLNGTNGVTTPGVVNSAGETIATTLAVAGAATVGGSLGVTGATTLTTATATSLQVGGVTTNVYPLVSGTAVTCAGQTSIDFSTIPSWVKRITVTFSGVSTNGTSPILIQLGTGTGPTFAITGYSSYGMSGGGSSVAASSQTTGLVIGNTMTAANIYGGSFVITNVTGNSWSGNGMLGSGTSAAIGGLFGAGNVTLDAALTAVRVTTESGTQTFDATPSAGQINILYE